MLHRVEPPLPMAVGPFGDGSTDPADLERYLEERRGWARPTPDRLFEQHADGPNAFLLTFDDGYRDFKDTVLPLLERFEAPALWFIPTGFLDGDPPPFELTLARLLTDHEQLRVPGQGAVALRTADEKQAVYERLRTPLRPASPRRRTRWLERLAEENSLTLPAIHAEEYVGWDELVEIDRHPLVTIGGHTHGHPWLPGQSGIAGYREIASSRRKLERVLGHRVDSFAYPYGGEGWMLRRLVRWAGYRRAFTTRAARIRCGERVEPLAIPRIDFARIGETR